MSSTETLQVKSSTTNTETQTDLTKNSEFFQLDDDAILAPFVNVIQLDYVITRLKRLQHEAGYKKDVLKRRKRRIEQGKDPNADSDDEFLADMALNFFDDD